MLLLIWADEKYSTPKNACVFFATPKNSPHLMNRSKNIPFDWNFRPQKNPLDPLARKYYVSGAPGVRIAHVCHKKNIDLLLLIRIYCQC